MYQLAASTLSTRIFTESSWLLLCEETSLQFVRAWLTICLSRRQVYICHIIYLASAPCTDSKSCSSEDRSLKSEEKRCPSPAAWPSS